ncbi:MAG: hypothetical protein ACK5OW_01575 [bacterium]|jgi:hypothetical protein
METINEPYYLYKYVVKGVEYWTPSLIYATSRSEKGVIQVQVG